MLHHVLGAILSQHGSAALGVHEDLSHVLDVRLHDLGSAADFGINRGRCQKLRKKAPKSGKKW